MRYFWNYKTFFLRLSIESVILGWEICPKACRVNPLVGGERRFGMTGIYIFTISPFPLLPLRLQNKSKTTPIVIAISATLNTAKYCTLIKSVTEPKIVRSRAFKNPPVMIRRYPIFSISEIVFQDFQRNMLIPRSMKGITNEIPGRGVPKATPVFFA